MNLGRICGLCPVQGGLGPVRTLPLATISGNQGYASLSLRYSPATACSDINGPRAQGLDILFQ